MAQLKWLIATQKKKKKEKRIELGRHPHLINTKMNNPTNIR